VVVSDRAYTLDRDFNPSPAYVYSNVDMPVLPCLVSMERAGVLIDTDHLNALIPDIESRQLLLRDAIGLVAGQGINLNSPLQVAAFLFDQLGLPTSKKRGKERSTDVEALEPLKSRHPAVSYLLEHRRLEKMRGTYVAKIPRVLGADGRLRASFNNVRVVTGRLSSSDPVNLQNIPKRVVPGTPASVEAVIRQIRRAFVARPGWRIVKFDQAQVEFRIIVCWGNDLATIRAINEGRDVHLDSVAGYLGRPYDEVAAEYKAGSKHLEDLRNLTKNCVYGAIYGQTHEGLCEYANTNGMPMSAEDAYRFQNGIMATKPGVVGWIEETKRFAARHGYVETFFGRRIRNADVWDERPWVREKALREMVNAPIQGTSADIMKIAMARLFWAIKGRGMRAEQVLAVHDECVFECPEEEVDELVGLINEIATTVVSWPVPLEVDCAVGLNWVDCEKVKMKKKEQQQELVAA
jgi:DNA polymerase I